MFTRRYILVTSPFFRIILCILVLFGIASCTRDDIGRYDSRFFGQSEKVCERNNISVGVITDQKEDLSVYKKHQKGFYGGNTTLTLPLGEIVKHAAERALDECFEHVVDLSGVSEGTEIPKYLVHYKILTFEHWFSSDAFGGGYYPTVDISLAIEISLHGESLVFKREYASGPVIYRPTVMEFLWTSKTFGDEFSSVTHLAAIKATRAAVADLWKLCCRPL